VLAWRLGQVLAAARCDQRRQVLVGEDGVRYGAMLATWGNTPGPAHHRADHDPRGPSSRPSSEGAKIYRHSASGQMGRQPVM
jgi:hypothetical protein